MTTDEARALAQARAEGYAMQMERDHACLLTEAARKERDEARADEQHWKQAYEDCRNTYYETVAERDEARAAARRYYGEEWMYHNHKEDCECQERAYPWLVDVRATAPPDAPSDPGDLWQPSPTLASRVEALEKAMTLCYPGWRSDLEKLG